MVFFGVVFATGAAGFLMVTSKSLSELDFEETDSLEALRARPFFLVAVGVVDFRFAAAFLAAAAAASLAAPEPFF